MSRQSAYSKMYLVTPAIYEKMLKCLDEGERKLAEQLNEPSTQVVEKRPSESILENISSSEVMPDVQPVEALSDPESAPAPAPAPAPAAMSPQQVEQLQSQIIGTDDYDDDEDIPLSVIKELRKKRKRILPKVSRVMHDPIEEAIIPPTTSSETTSSFPPLPVSFQSADWENTPLSVIKEMRRRDRNVRFRDSQDEIYPKRIPDRPCLPNRLGQICSPQPQSNLSPSKQRKQCHICLKWYDRQYGLDRHMSSVHRIEKPASLDTTNFPLWGGDRMNRKRNISRAKLTDNYPEKVQRLEGQMETENIPSRKRSMSGAKFTDNYPRKVLKMNKEFEHWQ